MFDVAHEGGAHHVQGAGFGRQNPAVAQLAQHQRADAQRVARADHLGSGLGHQGVTALDPGQGVDETVDDLGFAAARDQVEDDFGVGGRLEDGAFADQLAVQEFEVGQVAVVGDGDAALVQVGEHRLDVAQEAAAGGGVAGVAHGRAARHPRHQVGAAEGLAHQPLVTFGVETLVLDAGDAAGFLAAMLQGVKAQSHDGGALVLVGAPDAADAAFQAKLVVLRLAPVFAVDDGIGDMVAHRGAPMTGGNLTGGFARRVRP